ncbi:MAG: hypothetical protein DWQ49_09500 [Bacteroidetes bacterium]|nr:MAG: hypothetical protein DWQ49_09500 [Bacteroidota bacterium]
MAEAYEDREEDIERELAKRRKGWNLDAIADVDFEDVCQIIRRHIALKWHLWDQERPFLNWVNTVISNQLRNIRRNVYGNFAPPCSGCPGDAGGESCSILPSGKKGAECLEYAEWLRGKKVAYDIKLAAPLEESRDIKDAVDTDFNFEVAIAKLHEHMKRRLNSSQYEIYKMLYIDNIEESEIAKKKGYITSEKNRKPGYKQLYNLKKTILNTAKQILEEEDIIWTT